jgi:putative ATPase
LNSDLGHGAGYEYSHDQPGAWSAQEYLPEARRYYEPVERGHEAVIRARLEELRRCKRQADEDRADR